MLMNSLNVVKKSKLPNIILEYHNIHAFMYWSTLVSFSLSFCKALQFEIETSMILQFDNLLSQCKINGSKINCICPK